MDKNIKLQPKHKTVIDLLFKNLVVFTLINQKDIVGEIVNYDDNFIVVKARERRLNNQTNETVVIPFTSIVMIRILEN